MDLRLKEDWAEILRCALRPLTALLGVYYEALSPTTATARFGLGYWIYYKYTLRLPLWIPLFWNLRDCSRLFYPLNYPARGTRSSSTGSIWIFLRNAACYGFGARRARAADIRILAYRDITMGVKFDSKASWILDKVL